MGLVVAVAVRCGRRSWCSVHVQAPAEGADACLLQLQRPCARFLRDASMLACVTPGPHGRAGGAHQQQRRMVCAAAAEAASGARMQEAGACRGQGRGLSAPAARTMDATADRAVGFRPGPSLASVDDVPRACRLQWLEDPCSRARAPACVQHQCQRHAHHAARYDPVLDLICPTKGARRTTDLPRHTAAREREGEGRRGRDCMLNCLG